MEIQKTHDGVSIMAHQKIVTKDLHLYTISKGPRGTNDKFYLISPHSKKFTLINEGMEKNFKKIKCVYYLIKFLETAKLFEATGGNPLGIYMRYKTNVKIQLEGESLKNGIYPNSNKNMIDYIFYQTLCLVKVNQAFHH
jgi:hypothetical protein